ncbi:MAG: hypothetical protein NCW75_09860 [Phycisphaera sp.]|nr:MAG: hypothetical protein NCW75_09860 [Phycisphaera sp.]
MATELPPPPPFDHRAVFDEIAALLRPIDLKHALLTCRHAQAFWQSELCDDYLRHLLDSADVQSQPLFHGANLARVILLHCAERGGRPMDGDTLVRVVRLIWDSHVNDPASADLASGTADVLGFLMRYGSAQTEREPNPKQAIGLAFALFTDAMPVGPGETMDVPRGIDAALGFPAFEFMRAGFVSMSLAAMQTPGGIRMSGIASKGYVLDHLSMLGKNMERYWLAVTRRLACTPEDFRARANQEIETLADDRYWMYAFNPLKDRPFIETADDRWIAPVPDYVVGRITRSMWHDLNAAHGNAFRTAFGFRFQNLVGHLAASTIEGQTVIQEHDLPSNLGSEIGTKSADVVITGPECHVLVECKALQASQRLLSLGRTEDVEKIIERLTDAMEQVCQHAASINRGEWAEHGIGPKPCVGVVVSFGQVLGVQGDLLRNRIAKRLADKGCTPIPYLLLSIGEFDTLMKLAELRFDPAKVIRTLSEDENGLFPGRYSKHMADGAISLATTRWADTVTESLRPGPIQETR